MKKSLPQRTAVCVAMQSFQMVFWLLYGWRDAVSLENVFDRLIGDIVTEVGQCAGDPIVAPTGALPGHALDERLNRRIHARASGIGTMLRAVELAGNQTTIPSQDRIWFGNAGHLRQMFAAQRLGDVGRCKRSVSESRSRPVTWERRTRFSAIRYSHWRSRRWFTRPVMYANSRAQLLSRIMNQHGSGIALGLRLVF